MNRSSLISALLAGLSLSLVACEKPTVVNVPAAEPGPAGPQGALGNQGSSGETGKTGADAPAK